MKKRPPSIDKLGRECLELIKQRHEEIKQSKLRYKILNRIKALYGKLTKWRNTTRRND